MGNIIGKCFTFSANNVEHTENERHAMPLSALNVDWTSFGPQENAYQYFANIPGLSERWAAAARCVIDQIQRAGLNSQIHENLFIFLERLGFPQIRSMDLPINANIAEQNFLSLNITSLLKIGSVFFNKLDELLQRHACISSGREQHLFLQNLEARLLEAVQGIELCAPGVLSRLSHFLTISDLLSSANPMDATLALFKNRLFNEIVLNFYHNHSVVPAEYRLRNDVHYLRAVKESMWQELGLVLEDFNDTFANGMRLDVVEDLSAGLARILRFEFSNDILFARLAKQCISDFQEMVNQYGIYFPINLESTDARLATFEEIIPQLQAIYGNISYSLFLDINEHEIVLQKNPVLIALQLSENANVPLASEYSKIKTLFRFENQLSTYELKKNDSLEWMELTSHSGNLMRKELRDNEVIDEYLKNLAVEKLQIAISDVYQEAWIKNYFVKNIMHERKSECFQALIRHPEFLQMAKRNLFMSANFSIYPALNFLIAQGIRLDGEYLDKAEKLLFSSIASGSLGMVRNFSKILENLEIMDTLGKTPLFAAIELSNLKVVRVLVKAGVDINNKCLDGKTPLMYSILKEKLDIFDYLMGCGANVDAKNNDGVTALMLSCAFMLPHFVHQLILNGAEVNLVDRSGHAARDYLVLALRGLVGAEHKRPDFLACFNILRSAGGMVNATLSF